MSLNDTPVGIGDMELYVPRPYISIEELIAQRSNYDAKLGRQLQKSMQSTGQIGFRYTEQWEDSVTLSAQAACNVLRRQNQNTFDVSQLRYIAVGTETGLDHSKPLAAHVEGILSRASLPISHNVMTFQVQHACAGGTIALMNVGAMLKVGGTDSEYGVVICADVARYDKYSLAEITQGAGAVAMIVEQNPRLLELDIASVGYSSYDVDDFFRPIGVTTPRVKANSSIRCYVRGLNEAFAIYCQRSNSVPRELLEEIDLFVLHVPFPKMAQLALRNLLLRYGNIEESAVDQYIAAHGVYDALDVSAHIGNIYTGSAYLMMMTSFSHYWKKHGDAIVGKRVLLCSYGSGNTMIVTTGKIAAQAPDIIRQWDIDAIVQKHDTCTFMQYEQWMERDETTTSSLDKNFDAVPAENVYLAHVRDDGYREYKIK